MVEAVVEVAEEEEAGGVAEVAEAEEGEVGEDMVVIVINMKRIDVPFFCARNHRGFSPDPVIDYMAPLDTHLSPESLFIFLLFLFITWWESLPYAASECGIYGFGSVIRRLDSCLPDHRPLWKISV